MAISPRLALIVGAMILGGPVLPGLVAPHYIAPELGLNIVGVDGDNEFRAVYGGLAGGVVVFFALASSRPAWHHPGLVAQLCALAGMVIARIVSLAVAGGPSRGVYFMLTVEALGAFLAFSALRSQRALPAA